MKFKKTKAVALSLVAAVACGALAGCDFVTTDHRADLNQVIATVDISLGEDFQENGEYGNYAETIQSANVYKRDMVANFASYGSVYVNSYGYTEQQTYELIKDSLVNRQIFLQYAQVYFFENEGDKYNPIGYAEAVSSADEQDKEIAGIRYFLDDDETAAAEYALKQMFNSTLDSQETSIIEQEADEHDHDTARTTPTGVDVENEDFYDPNYQIYTGTNAASACGSYETVDGSTPSTRRKAYKSLLSNLDYYGLISKGENTSDVTALSYYAVERRTQYETALVNKLTEKFEENAAKTITRDWIVNEKLAKTLESQKAQFGASDASALETALDGVSDTSFVLYAPAGYGFVMNILLPFSTLQTQALNDAPSDLNDPLGNKFAQRASLLRGLTATDQRNTWFTGHEDYSYVETDASKAFTNGDAERKYLFFENNMTKSEGDHAQYEKIENYDGRYTYNGKVVSKEDEDGDVEYAFQPTKLSIDDFLAEMKAFLGFAGLNLTNVHEFNDGSDSYYKRSVDDYYTTDDNGRKVVDYSSFLYYEAQIAELADFDANKIFVAGSDENKAMSVMNALSFAYNTDTAGLNSYLGYSISPNSTDYMKEFEYAAQRAVRNGPGSITVAPTDYGWHIMYCTFAYTGEEAYRFNWDERETEGTFSYLYYEAMKAENFTNYSQSLRTKIINAYDNDECIKVFEERYRDLWQG